MPERFQTILSDQPVPERHVFNSPAHGAEIQFRGVVREWEEGKRITGIRYSAYTSMAEANLHAIAAEATTAHPDSLVFIHHLVGFVAAGQASVLVAVAMPHSPAAFSLCEGVLRRLKSEVPIWKEPCWAKA